MSAGGLMIKITNTNYEWVRDQYGIPAAAGLGLGGFALLIFGVVLLISAALPTRSTSPAPSSSLSYPITAARTPAQISVGARVIFSLLGLILGAVACFYMYIASASALLDIARQIDTETAKKMAIGSALMAFILAFVALLIGFIGLFVRRLPMLRVPVFFLLGAMVLYTSFQTLRIHPVNWPTFMAEFTKSFKNRRRCQRPPLQSDLPTIAKTRPSGSGLVVVSGGDPKARIPRSVPHWSWAKAPAPRFNHQS